MNPQAFAAALFLALAGTAAAAPFAYVPNEKSGTISVIDTDGDTVVRTIATGGKPRGIAISPDGKTVYVSEQTGSVLLVVDAAGIRDHRVPRHRITGVGSGRRPRAHRRGRVAGLEEAAKLTQERATLAAKGS